MGTQEQVQKMSELEVGDRVYPLIVPGEYWDELLEGEADELKVIELRTSSVVVDVVKLSKRAILFSEELDTTRIRKRIDPCSWMDSWEK